MSTAQKFVVVAAVLVLLMGGSWYMGWRAAHKSILDQLPKTPEAYFDALTREAEQEKKPVTKPAAYLSTEPKSTDPSPDPFAPLGPPARIKIPR